jgi:hypothetical protein
LVAVAGQRLVATGAVERGGGVDAGGGLTGEGIGEHLFAEEFAEGQEQVFDLC